MDKLFLTVLNMSITASFVIAAVCLARLIIKKAPKIISYCLWAVVLLNLITPFKLESAFSLVPFRADPIPESILVTDAEVPFISAVLDSMRPPRDETIIRLDPNKIEINSENNPYGEGVDTRYLFGYEAQFILARYIWAFGVIVLIIYGIATYVVLKRKMLGAAYIENNIYEAENIKSPFVLGIFKPKIYLPIGLSEKERGYVMLHEQTHIRRHDHIVKFGAYFVLCLHWFNPLAWVAFILMGADMEMSCDERVLKEMGGEIKKEYSLSLLSLATERRIIGGSPLAFGEGGIKERIKNVLNFKKPSRIIIIVATALVAVLSVGFAVNRANSNKELDNGDLRRNDMPDSISIYDSMNELYRNVADDIPLLVIEDSDGIKLFYNMIKNSEKLPGVLDVMASPYVATINYGLTVETIDLYLSFPNEHGRIAYEGTYINHNNSLYGYKFQTADIEAFLQAYKTELYDTFMAYLITRYNSTDNGAYKPSIMYENVIYSISPYKTDTYTILETELSLVGTVKSVVNGTMLPQHNLQASGNTDLLNCNIYTVSARYPNHLIVLNKNGGYSVYIAERNARNITLDDVWAIAQNIGTDLTMGDLRGFIGEDVGSGIYVMKYIVEKSDYILLVGTGDMNTIFYATLTHATDSGKNESIDIRYYDVDKFVKDETKELVRPLPEPQETTTPPEKAPQLEVNLIGDELINQRIQAAQLATSWFFVNENGEGSGYESESPHPLQFSSYDDITLQLYQNDGVIALYFSDNYPPQSISVKRWDVKYAGTESYDEWGDGEPIDISGNKFSINDNGNSHIYEVYAKWEQGSSHYAFRIDRVGNN